MESPDARLTSPVAVERADAAVIEPLTPEALPPDCNIKLPPRAVVESPDDREISPPAVFEVPILTWKEPADAASELPTWIPMLPDAAPEPDTLPVLMET